MDLDDLILEAIFQPQQQNLFSSFTNQSDKINTQNNLLEMQAEINSSDLREIKAIQLHEVGEFQEALKLLDEVPPENPHYASALNNK